MDKITQERYNKSRERSDRISALMGQYMLKGYRMLGSACDVCGVGNLLGFPVLFTSWLVLLNEMGYQIFERLDDGNLLEGK